MHTTTVEGTSMETLAIFLQQLTLQGLTAAVTTYKDESWSATI